MSTKSSNSLGSAFPHPNSFFTRLPFDIRAIIYSYLESGDLPPLAPKFQCFNFFLCCRQAKQEIEEIASIRVKYFLASFKQSTSIELYIQPDPRNYKNLTVVLPFTALYNRGLPSQALGWEREFLVGLHPLLSQYFDTLRIHFSGDPDTVPAHSSLLERGKLEIGMHSLLRDLGYMIERVNRVDRNSNVASDYPPGLETIFWSRNGENLTPYPNAQVAVKRICLSWDLRASGDQEVELNGKLHHARISQTCSKPPRQPFFPGTRALIRWMEKVLLNKTNEPVDPYRLHVAMYYQLRDAERLAGEMGIISPLHWRLTQDESLGLNALVNGIDTDNKSYVSSKGLGTEIMDGLMGISVQHFEEEEAKVQKVLWTT
jgi:hypothetical protein